MVSADSGAMEGIITDVEVQDIRFPTSLQVQGRPHSVQESQRRVALADQETSGTAGNM